MQRRNVVDALAAARELPQLSLEDALELTPLVARKDPGRHPRVSARWLRRYLEEDPAATIEEAALAASSLIALTGAGYQEAVQTLRAMAERATRRRRELGVARAWAGGALRGADVRDVTIAARPQEPGRAAPNDAA